MCESTENVEIVEEVLREQPILTLTAASGIGRDETPIYSRDIEMAQVGDSWLASASSALCGQYERATLVWRSADGRRAALLIEGEQEVESHGGVQRDHSIALRGVALGG